MPASVVAARVDRPPLAWRPVGLVACVAGLLMLASSGAYGYHRDELYFRLLGQQPSWGYVDQPPATPMLARLTVEVLGDHLWALRLPGAVILAGTAILTALLAREVGGGRGPQLLAAAGSLTLLPLTFGHLLVTSTLDMALTAAVLLCAARALLRDARWWLAVGVLVGVALYNKHLIVLTLVSIGVALMIVGPRPVLWSRWLLGGVGLALVIGAPNVLYQLANDWPQLEMARAIERNKGEESRTLFLPLQLALVGVFLAPVWIAGLIHLLRDPSLRPARALAVAYPVLALLVVVTGGQPYYTSGLVLALFAAGSIPTIRWMSGSVLRRAAFGGALVASALVSALFALPVLPVSTLASTPIADINQAVSDQIGWPVYVQQVIDVHRALPAAEAQRTVIITANYGEAGALDRFGGPDLPPVVSGHNELWFRDRPPAEADVAVAVGFPERSLAQLFAACDIALVLDNGVDIPNEEQGLPVQVCRGPVSPWNDLWKSLRHYD
jgi:hypothetical protein